MDTNDIHPPLALDRSISHYRRFLMRAGHEILDSRVLARDTVLKGIWKTHVRYWFFFLSRTVVLRGRRHRRLQELSGVLDV